MPCCKRTSRKSVRTKGNIYIHKKGWRQTSGASLFGVMDILRSLYILTFSDFSSITTFFSFSSILRVEAPTLL